MVGQPATRLMAPGLPLPGWVKRGLCAGVPVDGPVVVHARLDQVAQLCHALAHQAPGDVVVGSKYLKGGAKRDMWCYDASFDWDL